MLDLRGQTALSFAMTKRFLKWISVAACCAFLTSCFETEQEFTLNPDGTGKMVLDTTFPNVSLDGRDERSEQALEKAVAEFLKESEGIVAWKDVSYKWADDGRIHFKGTGYFPDISAVKLKNIGSMEFRWLVAEGNGTLEMNFQENENQGAPKKISQDPAERAKEIEVERAKFQQSKPMLAGFLNGMQQTASFNLPGKAGEASNFTADDTGKLTIKLTGEKMLAAMEGLVNDDEWIAKNGFDAQQGPAEMDELNEGLFGTAGPARVTRTSVDKPLFDYAGELAAAQRDFAELQEKFTVQIGPAADGEPFESLEVVGVRMVSEVDEKLKLRPFFQDSGYTLSVLGKFSGSVMDVTNESKLQKAIADDGSDLMPKNRFGKGINSPKLSEDQSAVLFEIELSAPGKQVKSIKEVSGTIQYKVSSGVKEVELGFPALKSGEKGKELSAEITEIKEGWQKGDSKEMEIKLAIELDAIKEMVLTDGAKRAVLEKRGHSYSSGGPTTLTYYSKTGIPEGAKLTAVLHDGVKTFDIPFQLENLSLLGGKSE